MADSAPTTISVAFNDLPQPVREWLMPLFTANPRDPRVLAFEVRTAWSGLKRLTRLVSAVVIAVCVWQVLTRAFRYSVGSSEEYQILAAALTVFMWSQLRISMEKRWPPPPYREGRWALPGAIVETWGGWLQITPMSALGKPTIVTVMRQGAYQYSDLRLGEKLSFSFGTKEAVEAACTRILEAREKVSELVAKRDLPGLAELDPFAECTLSGTWGRPGALSLQGPTVAIAPQNIFVQWIAPIIVALLLTVGLGLFVNRHLQQERDLKEAAK